jgi:hypothetical protein
LEVSFFEDKLKELKDATNVEGKNWIVGLLREPQKWTRAYVEGVGLPLQPTLRGLSSIVEVRELRQLCVPTPAVDVVTHTRRSAERVGSS